MATTTIQPRTPPTDDGRIAEKKRVALTYLPRLGSARRPRASIPEILAHAALFRAFAGLIETYGEEAVAGLAKTLPAQIRAFEFSVQRSVQ